MRTSKKSSRSLHWQFVSAFLAITFLMIATTMTAQSVHVAFDASSKVFRLDGGGLSYVFGVNQRGEPQQIYWGGRLGANDALPPAQAMREAASFDSSYTTTPQEYAGWGGGLFVEPALKVTFADGNRDLVLHYESHTVKPDGLDVALKDISRKIYVTLHYSVDGASGILGRSATIENREAQPITIEQAAAAAWALPP